MAIIRKCILIVAVFCFVNAQHTNILVNKSFLKLELVQVNFRHGIRTPNVHEAKIANITDPKMYGSYGFGQLTNEGKYQSYKLGQLLRKEYDKFLGKYEAYQLYAYTSTFDRAKMTLQLVLTGLYPPSEDDRWHPTLQWRPIPFASAPRMCDTLTTPNLCTKFNKFFEFQANQSEEYQNLMAKYNDFFDYIEKISGVPFKTNIPYYIGWTYNALKIHKIMNISLPEWCEDEKIVNQIPKLLEYVQDALSMTQKLKRLNGGTMIRQVIENIERNRNAEKAKKLYLYSHHDITMASFERAQGIKIFDSPPFGSAIILEKYRDDNDVEYVRFVAWDGEDDKFFTVKLNGCEEFCPYEDYRNSVKDAVSTDEDLEFLSY